MNNQSQGQHIGDDLEQAAKKGVEAAKVSKTAAELAKNAATGNLVGAAYSLMRSDVMKGMGKAIIAIMAVFLIFVILCLYALPMAVFAPVESYTAELEEIWNQARYSSDAGAGMSAVMASLKITGDRIGTVAADAWGRVKEALRIPDSQGNQEETGDHLSSSGYELEVMSKESALRQTLEDKLDTTISKISMRQDDLRKAILLRKNDIEAVIRKQYADDYDQFYVNLSIETHEIAPEEAVSLLSLYTVQEQNGAGKQEVSDYMQWLGWSSTKGKQSLVFSLADYGVECTTKAWKGTFMPQYLVEQKYQEETMYGEAITDYSEYGCAAVDLLLYVDCPDLEDIPVLKTTKRKTRVKRDADGNPVINPQTGEAVRESYVVTIGTANVTISILPRDMSILAQAAGLWTGDLSGDGITDPGGYRGYLPEGTGGSYEGTGRFTWPIPGYTYISSPFGTRRDPITGKTATHYGIDIPAATGTPVVAAADGVVIAATRSNVRGNYVMIQHTDGYITLYEHMNALGVRKGANVTSGSTVVGYSGSTGRSTGPHLHFEVILNGDHKNPLSYFR